MKRSSRDTGFPQGGRAGNRKRKRVVRAPPKPKLYYGRRSRNIRTGGLLGIERKFYTASTVGTALSAAGMNVIGPVLNTPAQGDTADSRQGAMIMMKSIQIEGYVNVPSQINQTAADTAAAVFLALVLDTQANGSAITAANVYTNPSGNAALAPLSVRNIQYSRRYKVLAVVRLNFDQPNLTWDGTNIEQGGRIRSFSIFRNLMIPCQFSGTTGVIGSLTDNSLYLIGCSSNNDQAPVVSFNSQMRFTDA